MRSHLLTTSCLVATTTIVAVLLASPDGALAQTVAPTTFVFSVDLMEGTTGYYTVEGYEELQPTLTMVRGQEYTFDQMHASNWFHPLGFAYEPDGAHRGVDELEEGIGTGDAPVYLIDGELSDLDTYEPQFFYPEEAWLGKGYSVNLTVTNPDVTEIFYFCHIHDGMSGRISIVDAEGDTPTEPAIELYEPLVRDTFDVECGTFESVAYAPNEGTFESDMCPGQAFLCGDPDNSFDRCMHAIDCKMNVEMRVQKQFPGNNAVAFMHQMIPHHENAVNMARVLLKHPGDEELDEEVAGMLREIVNSQNAQITFMRGYLADQGASETAQECANEETVGDGGGDDDLPTYAISIMSALGLLCVGLLAALVFRPGASKGGKVVDQGAKGKYPEEEDITDF